VNAAEEFIHLLDTGEPLHPTLDYPINLAAMAILDAGIRERSLRRVEDARKSRRGGAVCPGLALA
jgi:hypothetical protein